MEEKNIFKELLPYVIIIIVVVLIRTFIVTPVKVDGTSMVPTLKDKEILMLKKYDHSFERFDIVVFDYNGRRLIKRVIGLPGEYVEYRDGILYIDGEKVEESFHTNTKTKDFKLEDINLNEVPENTYFVMGDNRGNSTDSRIIGVVSKSQIKGSTNFSIFPFKTFGTIETRN